MQEQTDTKQPEIWKQQLRTTEKCVGLKQSVRALEKGEAVAAFLAEDAAPDILDKLKKLCESANVPMYMVCSMKELGQACGIDVGAAVAVTVGSNQSNNAVVRAR